MTEYAEVGKETRLWNQWLGHICKKRLEVLMNCKLLPKLKALSLDFCKYYVYGQQHRQKIKAGSHNNKGVLYYIHSNL